MDERNAARTRPSGMNTWRAGCGESRTSGSEGGPGKPTSREADRAPRPDPYTEHPTREGKVYCAVVLDTFSRKVVGWSIDAAQTATLVTNALNMAVNSRQPTVETVIHSDHGVQYTSWVFTRRVHESGLLPSMGSIGDCYDNGMMESFWGRMQTELLNRRRWKTRIELANAIFSTWRSFTTGNDATARWACSARLSMKDFGPSPCPSHETNYGGSTQPGVHHTPEAWSSTFSRIIPASCGRTFSRSLRRHRAIIHSCLPMVRRVSCDHEMWARTRTSLQAEPTGRSLLGRQTMSNADLLVRPSWTMVRRRSYAIRAGAL
jgi:hypothetical protein